MSGQARTRGRDMGCPGSSGRAQARLGPEILGVGGRHGIWRRPGPGSRDPGAGCGPGPRICRRLGVDPRIFGPGADPGPGSAVRPCGSVRDPLPPGHGSQDLRPGCGSGPGIRSCPVRFRPGSAATWAWTPGSSARVRIRDRDPQFICVIPPGIRCHLGVDPMIFGQGAARGPGSAVILRDSARDPLTPGRGPHDLRPGCGPGPGIRSYSA